MGDGYKCMFSNLMAHSDGCSIMYEYLYKEARTYPCWNMESRHYVQLHVEKYLETGSVVRIGCDYIFMIASPDPDGVALRLNMKGLFLNDDQMKGFQDMLTLYVSCQA